MRHKLQLLIGGTIAAGTLLTVVLWSAFDDVSAGPVFEREPSPYHNCDLVRECRSFFLDSFTKMWITKPGDRDRSRWQLVGPEVDGTYHIDWHDKDHCILTNYGWPRSTEVYQAAEFDGVKVDVRPPGTLTGGDSPDKMHELTIWTFDDTRGPRACAMLATSWKNKKDGSTWLLNEGDCSITGNWLTSKRLRLRVEPASAGKAVPRLWRGIEIIVE